MSIDGLNVLLTGASQGLGLCLWRHLMECGANVLVCARDQAALESAGQAVAASVKPGRRSVVMRADISRREDTDALVERALAEFGRIDVLVNNAGIYGPMGVIEDNDWDEWVATLNINLMGTICLTRAVVPHMKAQGRGKVVMLSGGGATQPLPGLSSYAVSKAGLVRFVETLALECQDFHIDVNAIAPGVLDTRLLDQVIEAGPAKVGQAFYDRMVKIKTDKTSAPLDRTAELVAFLASAESDGVSGKLISSLWDPWLDLPKHADELRGSDIYTLRRIIPADRGKTWGDV